MDHRGIGRWRRSDIVVVSGLAVVAAHLVNALLIQSDAGIVSRLGWAAVALGATATAAYFYRSLEAAWRGFVALAFGLPALLVGVAVHAVRVGMLGWGGGAYTGIPMLVSGLILTVTGATLLARQVHSWRRRLLLVPLAALLLYAIVFPVALGVAFTNVPRLPVCCDNTPDDFGLAYEEVNFKTPDGLTLTGWYIPSRNGAAIITVHGAFRPRVTTMPEAAILAKHGYGVLMIDLEGYGHSEGRINALGWVGARDIHAAVAWLKTLPDVDPDRIGGLGLSMGGEVLLQAAGESTELRAIVSEGGSARTWDDIDEMPGLNGTVSMVMQWTLGATMRVVSGESTPPPLKEMVRRIGPRPVLLIASSNSEELTLNRMYLDEGGPSFQLWETTDAKHVGALDLRPAEYEARVIAFFDETLLEPGTKP